MPVERRKLSFATLDEVVADAENLLANGYDRAGNWDLGQVAGHLANWLSYPVEGFPKFPLVFWPILWLMRVTTGKVLLREYLAEGMPSGKPTLRMTVPKSGGDPKVAVAKLNAAATKFAAHTGPIHPSPLFGAMNKDTAVRLQLRHCEHHLSFLIPKPV
ncbi:MAG: hypothetical protein C0467_09110 [Planctomycetaceae bacterium]|nr:hypothetical protein [Planctomycetaceae bacterium]